MIITTYGHKIMSAKMYYILIIVILIVTSIYFLLGKPQKFSDISFPMRCDYSGGDYVYCASFLTLDFWLHSSWKYENRKLFNT